MNGTDYASANSSWIAIDSYIRYNFPGTSLVFEEFYSPPHALRATHAQGTYYLEIHCAQTAKLESTCQQQGQQEAQHAPFALLGAPASPTCTTCPTGTYSLGIEATS